MKINRFDVEITECACPSGEYVAYEDIEHLMKYENAINEIYRGLKDGIMDLKEVKKTVFVLFNDLNWD